MECWGEDRLQLVVRGPAQHGQGPHGVQPDSIRLALLFAQAVANVLEYIFGKALDSYTSMATSSNVLWSTGL